MPATMTPDLLAHLAAVRDGEPDDADLLVLADHVQQEGDEDRAELIRVQCASHTLLLSERHRKYERELTARNPAWTSVPCPECKGNGLAAISWPCAHCDGTGDLLKNAKPEITRGFVTVTLPSTLCWRECPHSGNEHARREKFGNPCSGTVPHPVLAAVLDSPVGSWVRRVVVSDREPNVSSSHPGEWYLTGSDDYGRWFIPKPVFDRLDGRFDRSGDLPRCYHPTAEAATDALARAVPLWVRRCP